MNSQSIIDAKHVLPRIRAPEVKITPEMIDAGVDRLSRLDLEWDSAEQIVTAVFSAMAAAQDDAAYRGS
jgi:hypothetical protein